MFEDIYESAAAQATPNDAGRSSSSHAQQPVPAADLDALAEFVEKFIVTAARMWS